MSIWFSFRDIAAATNAVDKYWRRFSTQRISYGKVIKNVSATAIETEVYPSERIVFDEEHCLEVELEANILDMVEEKPNFYSVLHLNFIPDTQSLRGC
ncbi:hypothetical protein Trydic_g4563 [Trypoxylus dichotomus]